MSSASNFADPSIYNYRGFFEDYLTAKGKDWQGRLDFEYQTGLDFLPEDPGGRPLRRPRRKPQKGRGTLLQCQQRRRIQHPDHVVPLDYQMFTRPSMGTTTTDADKLAGADLRERVEQPHRACGNSMSTRVCRAMAIRPSSIATPTTPIADPRRNFTINEKTPGRSMHSSITDFDIGSVNVGGVLGMRWVQNQGPHLGNAVSDQPGPRPTLIEPISVANKYTDWLPNANMNIRFSPQWQLRLAVTKTRTRPLFEQLNPSLELDPPPATATQRRPIARGPDRAAIRS